MSDSPWHIISAHPHELGEGLRPAGRSSACWVDLLRGELYTWSSSEGTTLAHEFDRPLGFVERAPDGRLLAAIGTGVAEIERDGSTRDLGDTGLDPLRHRVNDGTIAHDGSLWFGTMVHDGSKPQGAVWRLHPESGRITRVAEGIDIPNGPVFLPDEETVLIADTAGGRILRAPITAPSELEVFTHVADGNPDGMHVDKSGRVWNAVWGGARVDVHDASGTRLHSIDLPATQATSVLLTDDADPLVVVTSATVGMDSVGEFDGHTLCAPLSELGL